LHKHRLSRQGFTLVELSIVLVIIGLLIGGILIGQSLVESAKINAQIKQLQQLDIAAQSFVSKFKYLPGDTDKDGWLEQNGGSNVPCAPSIFGECSMIFPQLSSMLGFPGKYSFTLPDTMRFGPGRHFPFDMLGRSGVHGVQNVRRELFWIIAASRQCNASDLWGCSAAAFTPSQALALDKKLDDGNAFAGKVASVTAAGLPSSCALGQSFCGNTVVANPDDYALRSHGVSTCANQTTGVFQTSNSAPTCGLQFKANIYK
jgi:prepilin-type N-terminal cleavage/methylation domain-containing protein